jgi:hypothetical protein
MSTKFKVVKPIRYLNTRYPVGSILELDETGIKVFENKPGLISEIKPEAKTESKPELKPEGKQTSKGKE